MYSLPLAVKTSLLVSIIPQNTTSSVNVKISNDIDWHYSLLSPARLSAFFWTAWFKAPADLMLDSRGGITIADQRCTPCENVVCHCHVLSFTYIFSAGLAQWIGRVTPNVASAGSIPRSRLKIYNWVAPLWLVFILHVSHCLIDLIYRGIYIWMAISDIGKEILQDFTKLFDLFPIISQFFKGTKIGFYKTWYFFSRA